MPMEMLRILASTRHLAVAVHAPLQFKIV